VGLPDVLRRTNGDAFDACVVGGGLAGLSAAVALADAGMRVKVFEAAPELGGRARSWQHVQSGDEVDIGPHVVHSEYANFLKFLERLGTGDQIEWQPRKLMTLATARGPYALRHRALPTPLSLLPDMARAPGLTLRDVLSNMRITRLALQFRESDAANLDRLGALDLLRRCGTTERMIDWFWRLASMTVMNVPLENCSAAALMRVHSQLIGHRDVHFGFAQVGLSRLYVEQCTRIIERAGGAVATHAEVLGRRKTGPWHQLSVRGSADCRCRFVVYAVPPAALTRLHTRICGSAAFEPAPYKSVYLWFDRNITSERFWSLLWRPGRLNYDFYDLAKIRVALRGRPSIIASNIIFSHRAEGMTDEAIVRATLAEIVEFAPHASRARVLHADVHHIPMAVACPFVGTESKRPITGTPVPGVFLAGDWTRTQLPCSMESAVRSGYLAAEAVLADTGAHPALAITPRPNDGLARWIGSMRGSRAALDSVDRS
jgi:squalene-associated FAD-dependent desaturase